MKKYITETARDFHADYRKTSRNAPAGQVFEDLGMLAAGERDGVTLLTFPQDGTLVDDGIIRVECGVGYRTVGAL